MQNFNTKVTEILPLAPNIVQLTVELVEPQDITFEAGQFMQFLINGQYRAYSIVNMPAQENHSLTFAVKLLEQGVGSDFVRGLSVGDVVTMRGALGVLTISDISKDYCLMANGVGVAPFVSKINDLLINRGYTNKITLVFGVRSEIDVFYHNELSELAKQYTNFEFILSLSKPQGDWRGQRGRVTDFLAANYESYRDRFFYLCGSQSMVTDTRQILLDQGHDVKAMKLEIFT